MQLDKYLLLVEKETYYVEVIKTDPLQVILDGQVYTIRDSNKNPVSVLDAGVYYLYKDDVHQGKIYNWMHAYLEPSVDIVMEERAALLNTEIDGYRVTRIVHHLHCSTLYEVCKDGIYHEMLINKDGRFISSPDGWVKMN